MAEPQLYMVFDVESIGLHGEGFSVGWVVVAPDGREVAHGFAGSPPENAWGEDAGRKWVVANVSTPADRYAYKVPDEVRDAFWAAWQEWKAEGAVLVADCAWPVEARFLIESVDDIPDSREWEGPYPLHDVATMRLAAGFDPLGTEERLPSELPIHDPLADARQSARLFVEALKVVRGRADSPR